MLNSNIQVATKEKHNLTRTKTKKKVVCQFRFVPLDETLDGSIPGSRLQNEKKQIG